MLPGAPGRHQVVFFCWFYSQHAVWDKPVPDPVEISELRRRRTRQESAVGEGYMPFCSRPTWEERVAIRTRNAEKARRKMQNSRSTLRARKRALEASSSSSSSSGGSSSETDSSESDAVLACSPYGSCGPDTLEHGRMVLPSNIKHMERMRNHQKQTRKP